MGYNYYFQWDGDMSDRHAVALYRESVHNLSLQDISVFGRSRDFIGTSEHRHGVQLVNTKGKLIKVDVYHCEGDGVYVGHKNKAGTHIGLSEDILLSDIDISFSGRNGLALVGVKNLRLENFSIRHTKHYPGAGAGIDFEPDHPEHPNSFIHIRNGIISNNETHGIISDNAYTSNVLIEDTHIVASQTGWAFWGNFADPIPWEHGDWSCVLRRCKIFGPITHLRKVLFIDCEFFPMKGNVQSEFTIDQYSLGPTKLIRPTFYGPYRSIESSYSIEV